jgi:hypothetical protein
MGKFHGNSLQLEPKKGLSRSLMALFVPPVLEEEHEES